MKHTQMFWIDGRGPTANKYYAGMHFRARQKLADDWHILTMSAIREYKIWKVEHYPVELEFNFFFKSHPQDVSNTSITAKMIEDGLVKDGILLDDKWNLVRKMTLTSTKADKNIIQVKIHHD
jgi:hypothetical protein